MRDGKVKAISDFQIKTSCEAKGKGGKITGEKQ